MDVSMGQQQHARHHRMSNSPPSTSLPHPHHSQHANDAVSEHSTTPALTPGSSAMSYTSGHSPPAMHSNTVSPTVPSYPSLPSLADGPQHMAAHGGPVDTLGTPYNSDVRRRYSGGHLQQQQRAPITRRGSAGDSMDVDSAAKGKARRDPALDPMLGGSSSAGSSSSSGSSSAASVASDDTATPGREEEAAHGFNLRLLENLKSFIAGKLERGEFEDEDAIKRGEDDEEDDDDEEDNAHDQRVRRALALDKDQDEDMEDAKDDDDKVPKPDVAYPELKM